MMPIVARGFFRLQEALLGRPSFAILRQLRESQYWPHDKLDALRLDRLRSLVTWAWEHIPYWRETMTEHHIHPSDIRELSDIRRFPLLEKNTLRRRLKEMTWQGRIRGFKLVRTSGSTNEALQFYASALREAHINAARMRGHESIGIRRGDREMYFWGCPVELNAQDRIKRIRDWLVNDGLTNGFAVTPERIVAYVEYWRRWRPKCLFGYPNCLALVARLAPKLGLDLSVLKSRGLKVISTTSELLTDADRASIESAFGVPVYDSYGLREGGMVGHDCQHKTMHTVDEQVLLETIDPLTGRPTDGEGELVLTNLVHHVMPIIRYRTGDIVQLSRQSCPCGRTLGSIRISGGRIADFVVTSNGVWIPGYAFIYICRSVPGVVKFQVHQERQGRIRVRLAVDANFPTDGSERVRVAALKRLASDDEVLVEVVDDIQPAPSGKYRPVVGDLAEELLKRDRHV